MKPIFAKLLGIPSAVWSFYAPLLKSLLVSGVAELLPIALEIVRSLATTHKSGSEKRDVAIAALREAAIKRGIDATESVIRWTIESAVQRMKVD